MSSFVPSRQGQTQLLLRLPTDATAQRFRELMAAGEVDRVELIPDEAPADENPMTFVSQRFTLKMDDETLPARLANLATLVETHKTLDRSTYYKTGDVGQIVVVYATEADRTACERRSGVTVGDSTARKRTCLADGLAPPFRDVVEKRFAKAAKRAYGPMYTAAEVGEAEKEMAELYAASTARTASQAANDEVFEEVVALEDWMLDPRTGGAVRDLTDDSALAQRHPWILSDAATARLNEPRAPYQAAPAGPKNTAPALQHPGAASAPATLAPPGRDSPAAPPENEAISERRERVASELSAVHAEIDKLDQEAKNPDTSVRARAVSALTKKKEQKRKLMIALSQCDEKLLFEAANSAS